MSNGWFIAIVAGSVFGYFLVVCRELVRGRVQMPFGNEDTIDQRNHKRIRQLEVRNQELASGFRVLIAAFEHSTSMTLAEKDQVILSARRILDA